MNINFKYYILTIGSIFLAIGIGIVIGFNINNNEELNKQQSNIVAELDKKFDILKSKNNELSAQIKLDNNNIKNLENYILKSGEESVGGKLQNTFTGVISLGEENQNENFIDSALKMGGGAKAFDIVINRNSMDKKEFEEISKQLKVNVTNEKELVDLVLTYLGDSTKYNELKEIESAGLIKINDLDASNFAGVGNVIIQDFEKHENPQEDYKKFAKNIVDKVKDMQKNIVYVRSLNSENKYEDIYSKDKVATLDNIDKPIGQYAYVLIASNNINYGMYGQGSGDVEVLPQIN